MECLTAEWCRSLASVATNKPRITSQQRECGGPLVSGAVHHLYLCTIAQSQFLSLPFVQTKHIMVLFKWDCQCCFVSLRYKRFFTLSFKAFLAIFASSNRHAWLWPDGQLGVIHYYPQEYTPLSYLLLLSSKGHSLGSVSLAISSLSTDRHSCGLGPVLCLWSLPGESIISSASEAVLTAMVSSACCVRPELLVSMTVTWPSLVGNTRESVTCNPLSSRRDTSGSTSKGPLRHQSGMH